MAVDAAGLRLGSPPGQRAMWLAGWHRQLFASALLLPALAAVLFLVVYPLIRVVELSLRKGKVLNFAKISQLPLSLDNYSRILGSEVFWHSVSVTAVYVAGSVAAAFVVGLACALLLNISFAGRRWVRTAILLPWAVPGVVVSIIFLWMFNGSFGVVNGVLRQVGLLQGDLAWFVNADTAMLAVIMPTVWKAYPLITLTLLAAMQSIPETLYEAGRIDGAGRLGLFRFVTWPGIRTSAVLACLVSALWIFRDIDIIFATTGGGPARATETLSIGVYDEAFQYFRMGTASAMGMVMIATALVASLLAARLVRDDRF